ncbi:hypothetical protein VPH35_044367 [Triticum aestivum]
MRLSTPLPPHLIGLLRVPDNPCSSLSSPAVRSEGSAMVGAPDPRRHQPITPERGRRCLADSIHPRPDPRPSCPPCATSRGHRPPHPAKRRGPGALVRAGPREGVRPDESCGRRRSTPIWLPPAPASHPRQNPSLPSQPGSRSASLVVGHDAINIAATPPGASVCNAPFVA